MWGLAANIFTHRTISSAQVTSVACHSEPTFSEWYPYSHFRNKKREFTAGGNEEQQAARKTKAQSPGSWLTSCLRLLLVCELPAAHKHPQGRMFPSMHLMNRVACVLAATLEIDPHRGMWNVEWTNGWRMWPSSARQDSPHTQPHAGTLSGLFGSAFFPQGLRTWWYKEPCVMISTPLLISCGPLSPDPSAGVLPTSQDRKSSPARGREGDRKMGRERGREERREESSHLQPLSQEFRNMTTAKASEASYRMLLFLGSLKIKLVVGWARCPSGCCRKQEWVGALLVIMGTTAWLALARACCPLRRN